MLKEEKELHDRILELCRWANVAPQSCLGKIKVLIRAVREDCAKVAENVAESSPCRHKEILFAIAEKADNLLHAAMLPVPSNIHVEGLKGGMEEIKKMAELRCRAVKE